MNRTGIRKQTATTPEGVLYTTHPYITVSVRLSNKGMDSTTKIIKRGTPLSGNLLDRSNSIFEDVSQGSASAVAVLLHDITFDDGAEANATAIVMGAVDTTKLATATMAKYTTQVKEDLKGIFLISSK